METGPSLPAPGVTFPTTGIPFCCSIPAAFSGTPPEPMPLPLGPDGSGPPHATPARGTDRVPAAITVTNAFLILGLLHPLPGRNNSERVGSSSAMGMVTRVRWHQLNKALPQSPTSIEVLLGAWESLVPDHSRIRKALA